MKIALFGSTGMIGSRILQEALSRGHHVTAITRTPEGAGNIMIPESVAQAVTGADLVISAYGPGPRNPDDLLKATKSLLAGLTQAGVTRLLAVGGAGSLEIAPGLRLIDSPNFPAEWKGIAQAHAEALELLRASSLEWTSLSPAANIHPGERTGNYRTSPDQLLTGPTGSSEISTEDFAIAMVDEAEQAQHIRQRFAAAW